ncbi:MAG: S41 family peptidase [Fimbriimonadales bacterium]|nr:S41 family peptidase [Fimbriimonadales bacterium]
MRLVFVKLGVALVFLAFCFVLGFALKDLGNGRLPTGEKLLAAVGIEQPKAFVPSRLYSSTFQKIQTDYYKKVDRSELKYASMAGMMASLGDPHTSFLDPKAAREFAIETSGNFVGVGARLSADPLGAKVVSVFEGSPAEKAGLRAADVITRVDGESVAGVPLDRIVSKIRGEPNTAVTLTVIRGSSDKPVTIRAVRAPIVAPTVEGRMLDDSGVAYIEITNFAEPTVQQFDRVWERLSKQGPVGLVIDVRGNPGGLLQTAVDLLSRFVDNKVVVKMRMRGGQEETARTESGRLAGIDVPIAVLINEDSASAAEIFAGVLRDYRLATLVGEHTYGKASVQNVFQLIDGANAKITIARYYLPSGEYIGRKVDEDGQYLSGGLVPEHRIDLDWSSDPVLGDLAKDAQLQKAVEVVKNQR